MQQNMGSASAICDRNRELRNAMCNNAESGVRYATKPLPFFFQLSAAICNEGLKYETAMCNKSQSNLVRLLLFKLCCLFGCSWSLGFGGARYYHVILHWVSAQGLNDPRTSEGAFKRAGSHWSFNVWDLQPGKPVHLSNWYLSRDHLPLSSSKLALDSLGQSKPVEHPLKDTVFSVDCSDQGSIAHSSFSHAYPHLIFPQVTSKQPLTLLFDALKLLLIYIRSTGIDVALANLLLLGIWGSSESTFSVLKRGCKPPSLNMRSRLEVCSEADWDH